MSREIKFRFWNKIARRFQPASKYAIDGEGKLVAYDYEMMAYDDPVTFSNTCIVAQQYTGLKDKNGIEIYEGDIVKATSDQYKNENFVGKVIFDEGCFLTWINKNDIRGIWGEDDIEVIGNIFETPELLEKL
jgi:uncharacterized phage protein (TIGR01671 family)